MNKFLSAKPGAYAGLLRRQKSHQLAVLWYKSHRSLPLKKKKENSIGTDEGHCLGPISGPISNLNCGSGASFPVAGCQVKGLLHKFRRCLGTEMSSMVQWSFSPKFNRPSAKAQENTKSKASCDALLRNEFLTTQDWQVKTRHQTASAWFSPCQRAPRLDKHGQACKYKAENTMIPATVQYLMAKCNQARIVFATL